MRVAKKLVMFINSCKMSFGGGAMAAKHVI